MIGAIVAVGMFATPTLEYGIKAARMSLSDPLGQRLPLIVCNRTKRPATVWVTTFFANHTMSLTDEAGHPVPMTPLGRKQRDDFEQGSMGRDKNAPITLPPGGSLRGGTPPLGESFALRPGRYRLTVEYWERQERPHLRMRTVPLSITVVP